MPVHRTSSEDQEAAEEEFLVRLVALNGERAAGEKAGIVRWLRPDYQKPQLAHKMKGQSELDVKLAEAGVIEERAWSPSASAWLAESAPRSKKH